MILSPRIPQGGRYAQMKADMQRLAEGQQANTIQPGVGTYIVQQTPCGTIIRARPVTEETEGTGEPIWL